MSRRPLISNRLHANYFLHVFEYAYANGLEFPNRRVACTWDDRQFNTVIHRATTIVWLCVLVLIEGVITVTESHLRGVWLHTVQSVQCRLHTCQCSAEDQCSEVESRQR